MGLSPLKPALFPSLQEANSPFWVGQIHQTLPSILCPSGRWNTGALTTPWSLETVIQSAGPGRIEQKQGEGCLSSHLSDESRAKRSSNIQISTQNNVSITYCVTKEWFLKATFRCSEDPGKHQGGSRSEKQGKKRHNNIFKKPPPTKISYCFIFLVQFKWLFRSS